MSHLRDALIVVGCLWVVAPAVMVLLAVLSNRGEEPPTVGGKR